MRVPTTRSIDCYRQSFQSVISAASRVGNLEWPSLAANSSGPTCCGKLGRQLGDNSGDTVLDPLCQTFSRLTPHFPATHKKSEKMPTKVVKKRVTVSISLRFLSAPCAALRMRLSEDSYSYSTRMTHITSRLDSELCRRCIHRRDN